MLHFTKTYTEMLENVAKLTDRQEQIALLQSYSNEGFANFLRFVFDPYLNVLLPKEDIPYTEAKFSQISGRMHNEARKLYIFVDGTGLNNLSMERRKQLFIQILESLDPLDAKLLHAAKNRKMLIKGVDVHLVNEAFPGLIVGYDQIKDEPVVEETNPMPVIDDTLATEEEIAKVMEKVTTTPAPKKAGRKKKVT